MSVNQSEGFASRNNKALPRAPASNSAAIIVQRGGSEELSCASATPSAKVSSVMTVRMLVCG